MRKNTLLALIFLCTIFSARLALPEAFGNNALILPRVGMAFFDAPVVYNKKPWGLQHQWTMGVSFMQAINYRWWWLADSKLGFGKLAVGEESYIGSFSGGAGLRFTIFDGDFRPHTTLMLHYLQLLGAGTRNLPLNLGWPIFVGLAPSVGMEWLFYSEMALSIDGSYGFYVNINEPFRQVLFTQAAFSFYF